jgi:Arc/MetJ family transcription regulator
MRTNVVLDSKLVEEAFRHAKVATKKELIDLALREFIENHKRRNVLQLRGKVKLDPNCDYKSSRD